MEPGANVWYRTRLHPRGLWIRAESVEILARELEARRGEAGAAAAMALRAMEQPTPHQRLLIVDVAPFATAAAEPDLEVTAGIRELVDAIRWEIDLL